MTRTFDGNFASGDIRNWPSSQGADDAITVVPDPLNPGFNAALFSVDDGDMTEVSHLKPPRLVYHTNPAAALVGRLDQFAEGDDSYVSWRVLLPGTFPKLKPGGWLLFGELHGPVYEPPAAGVPGRDQWFTTPPFGSPATALVAAIVAGQEVMGIARGYPHYDVIAHWPLQRGVWHRVAMHIHFSADPAKGIREVWHQSKRQPFVDGRVTWDRDNTLRAVPAGQPFAGDEERLTFIAMLYYEKGAYAPGPVEYYAGAARTGTDLASVS